MATHKWKIRVEIVADDSGESKMITNVEMQGANDTDADYCTPINEAIANDMGWLCQMISASGKVVGDTGYDETIKSFAGSFESIKQQLGQS